MKRMIPILLCVCLLAGCGASTPHWERSTASAEIEPYAQRAVEILDGYLSFQLTADEANDALDEIYKRMDVYDISNDNNHYNDVDRLIYHDMFMISSGQIEWHSDIENRRYCDELAFQIGEPVSDFIYPARQNISDDDDLLHKLGCLNNIPFDSGFSLVTESYCHAVLRFDQMNVPAVADLQEYISLAYDDLTDEKYSNISLSVYYSRYGQDVFYVSIRMDTTGFTGKVYRNDEAYQAAGDLFLETYSLEERAEMEGYPKEFDVLNPLFEFDSIEGLDEALTVAATFAGM